MRYMKRPDYLDPRSIRYKWRKRRFAIIEEVLRSIVDRRGQASIIDVGGTGRYWNLLSKSLASRCTITLVNTGAWLDPNQTTLANGVRIANHVGDGCDLVGFSDRGFDLAHSNSVIEHVGSLTRMSAFARELRRVGRNYYCQTPYLWFPIEPHYGVPMFHWLPAPTRARLLHRHKIGWGRQFASYEEALEHVDHTQLLDKTLFLALFPDATVHKERLGPLTKSLIAVKMEADADANKR